MTDSINEESSDIFSAGSSAILGTANKRRIVTSIENDQVIIVSAANPLEELVRKPVKVAYDHISSAATLTRQQLYSIYKQHQVQSQNWFRASIIAALIGFLVVVIGLIAILAGLVNGGIASTVVGLISEITSALFYRQANIANKQLRSDVVKLVDAERIHQAVELVLTVDDKKMRNELKASIISLVLQGKSTMNGIRQNKEEEIK